MESSQDAVWLMLTRLCESESEFRRADLLDEFRLSHYRDLRVTSPVISKQKKAELFVKPRKQIHDDPHAACVSDVSRPS